MKKILLLEDDRIISSGLVYALEQEGYSVTHFASLSELRFGNSCEQLETEFALAILDMQLPDGTGFDAAKMLPRVPKIFLTVVDDEGNIVRAFEEGAEDYITKPFRLRELLARIKRVLKSEPKFLVLGNPDSDFESSLPQNSVSQNSAEKSNSPGIKIDIAGGKVYLGSEMLDLTALEYRLLLTFAQNQGRILTRNQILEKIWDNAGNFVEDNTLSVYIKRLREKLGDSVKIETVRGIGYRLS
ncbi:MAG: response regulator transcription factor [Ruminococcus sp.]|jgi:DNA-binding response OmpR family regulator|nr:response regulator transcription factor [Ruminococcus sp.]